MAGKSSKVKGKAKGKSESAPDASTVASKEVQPLTGATGLPELVLKKVPAVPAAVEQLAVEAPKEDVAEALAQSPKVVSSAAVSEKTEGTDVSEETSGDEKKSNSEEAEARDGTGNGDADGDGKDASSRSVGVLNVEPLCDLNNMKGRSREEMTSCNADRLRHPT